MILYMLHQSHQLLSNLASQSWMSLYMIWFSPKIQPKFLLLGCLKRLYRTKVSYIIGNRFLWNFLKGENTFIYFHNISGLLQELGIQLYNPNNWRLFQDSSKRNLKHVLLQNSNVCTAFPVGHSVYLREEQNNIKTMIELLKYYENYWTICVDLKMVNFLLSQPRGFKNYPCFIWMWDSWARDKHRNQKVSL